MNGKGHGVVKVLLAGNPHYGGLGEISINPSDYPSRAAYVAAMRRLGRQEADAERAAADAPQVALELTDAGAVIEVTLKSGKVLRSAPIALA